MATNTEILTMLKTQYLAAITSPSPSYQIGEIRVDHNAYVKHLAEQIKIFEDLAANDEIVVEETFFI